VNPTGIYDKNGVKVTLSEEATNQIRVEATIKDLFGEAMNSSTMINGKILLPDGRGYDRNARKFLTSEEVTTL